MGVELGKALLAARDRKERAKTLGEFIEVNLGRLNALVHATGISGARDLGVTRLRWEADTETRIATAHLSLEVAGGWGYWEGEERTVAGDLEPACLRLLARGVAESWSAEIKSSGKEREFLRGLKGLEGFGESIRNGLLEFRRVEGLENSLRAFLEHKIEEEAGNGGFFEGKVTKALVSVRVRSDGEICLRRVSNLEEGDADPILLRSSSKESSLFLGNIEGGNDRAWVRLCEWIAGVWLDEGDLRGIGPLNLGFFAKAEKEVVGAAIPGPKKSKPRRRGV